MTCSGNDQKMIINNIKNYTFQEMIINTKCCLQRAEGSTLENAGRDDLGGNDNTTCS